MYHVCTGENSNVLQHLLAKVNTYSQRFTLIGKGFCYALFTIIHNNFSDSQFENNVCHPMIKCVILSVVFQHYFYLRKTRKLYDTQDIQHDRQNQMQHFKGNGTFCL